MSKIVQEALDASSGTVSALAEEAGASRESLHAWAAGRRNPSPENRQKLAEALRRRGGELARLADELEAAE